MQEYRMEKSTCEKYTLKWEKLNWAVFTIDENGLFNVQSEFGDYQFMWPYHGKKSFKHFILDLANNEDYLLEKISDKTYFNFNESQKQWRKKIIEIRKENECTKEQAREAWEFIKGLNEYSDSKVMLEDKLYSNAAISALSGGEPWYVFDVETTYPTRAKKFVQIVMPMFADIIRKELEEAESSSKETQVCM